jgi:outer membrane receptor protein involved in Fe transport
MNAAGQLFVMEGNVMMDNRFLGSSELVSRPVRREPLDGPKSTRLVGAVVMVLLVLVCNVRADESAAAGAETEDFFDMSLEELMTKEISSTATLTQTSARMAPAAITTITAEQIQASGARSLFELLDIYVPNLQWIRHHWEADHLGLRGIINDREDKYLLLVNGRIMNERTHFGAVSERDLVMLRDINHIDVIRGPGSALYGPGAVSMVINIVTDTPETFQGTEVTNRIGVVDEFYSTEVKHGERFSDDDGGMFMYAGIARVVGAGQEDAPQVWATDFPDRANFSWDPNDLGRDLPGEGYRAGDTYNGSAIPRLGETHRDLPPLKFHVEVTRGDWDIWARYTRGGQKFVGDVGTLTHSPPGWGDWVNKYGCSYGYQQATAYVGYKHEITDTLWINAAVSYDMMDFERILQGEIIDAHREDEYYGKLLFNWNPFAQHKLAFGAEISHEEFGLNSPGWPEGSAISSRLGDPMPRWSTNLYSLLGEHQWTINDQWTTFLGARLDHHTYTNWLFSPRAAVVYTPTAQDTLKLMWSRSVRANFAEEMKAAAIDGNDTTPVEKLDSAELRYERKQNEHLDLAGSFFVHYNLELLTWSTNDVAPVGTQRDWGFELEAVYHTEKTRLALSHSFTKLYSFSLRPGMSTANTSEPYGYGDDLANWSNHLTKLAGEYKLDDQWTLDGSLRIYWGFPGLESYNEYSPGGTTDNPGVSEGWEKGYRGNYYLDLGLQYEPSKNLTLRLDGYNLLGLFDEDLNKRNYYTSWGDYRCDPVAAALSMTYKF